MVTAVNYRDLLRYMYYTGAIHSKRKVTARMDIQPPIRVNFWYTVRYLVEGGHYTSDLITCTIGLVCLTLKYEIREQHNMVALLLVVEEPWHTHTHTHTHTHRHTHTHTHTHTHALTHNRMPSSRTQILGWVLSDNKLRWTKNCNHFVCIWLK